MILKENSFIASIGLLPFTILLSILKIKNVVHGAFYSYLLMLMIIVFTIYFIFALFYAIDEINNSNNKKRLILLILVPFIYLPIYYTKHVYKKEKYMGYCISAINVMLIISLFAVVKTFVNDYMLNVNQREFKVVDNFLYVDKNNNFTFTINNNYACQNNLGDYVIACDNKKDDSFIGIYSYQNSSFSQGVLDDILKYHIEQTINYIEEKGMAVTIEKVNDITLVNYSNMKVAIKQLVYKNDYSDYCLVVVKEVNSNNFDVLDFEKSLENIEFLV